MRLLSLKRATRSVPKAAVWMVLGVAALINAQSAAAENPCVSCHDEQHAALQATAHRGVVEDGPRFCESCHGDGARHLDSGEAADIVGPGAMASWTTVDESEACLTCHGADFPASDDRPHADLVSCWSCHGDDALHGFAARDDVGTARRHASWDLCTQCHAAVKAEFQLEYRHPVEAGLVDCVDCHDIHGREAVLSQSRHESAERCLACHKDQSGPYVFEHLAMEQGDGCASCHRPHGSWNRSMLVSTGNGVCTTCHLQSNFPGVGKVPHDFRLSGGATCWSCHSEIHGSNTTPDFNPRGRR